MNLQELTTWTRLRNLDLDAADAAFPFSARLARDNGWPRGFAARAIEEYRKFCFLAVHAGHPVTPSDEVDQVWHLHLTYSRHYWDTLCRDVLERPLHHGPTQGGAAEDCKFREWYEATLASYRRYFGEPPEDLWPDAAERFDARNDFVRVNRRDVMTLNRRLPARGALALLLGSGGLFAVSHALAQSNGASFGPSVALGLIVAVVLVMVAIVWRMARNDRHVRRRSKRDSGAASAGFVSGGDSSCHDAGGGNCADGGGASGCGSSGCGGGGGCGGGS